MMEKICIECGELFYCKGQLNHCIAAKNGCHCGYCVKCSKKHNTPKMYYAINFPCWKYDMLEEAIASEL